MNSTLESLSSIETDKAEALKFYMARLGEIATERTHQSPAQSTADAVGERVNMAKLESIEKAQP